VCPRIPKGLMVDICIRLEFVCTNNQAECESLLCGLDYLEDMGVKSAEAFRDSKLVVQQLNGDSQCLDGVLNCYRDKCLGRVKSWSSFCITHIPREDNKRADALAQQASSYQIRDGLFFVKERPTWQDKCASGQAMVETWASGELGRKREESMPGEDQGAGSVELRGERKSGGAKKESGLQETSKANVHGKDAGPDWREAIIKYMSSPSNKRDERVHQQALKNVVMDDELYRRTVDGMLLRCLGEEQSRLAMGEVHEGLCGTHQAAPKMKWALRRAGFF
jgi:ribonuclease HI